MVDFTELNLVEVKNTLYVYHSFSETFKTI